MRISHIRSFTLGRKNWLFCDTPKGADSSAIVYTLVETAKANGLEPYTYLLQVLTELPCLGKNPSQENLNAFLPWSAAMQATCAAKILRPRTGASDEAPGFCGWVVIERLSPTTFYGIVSIIKKNGYHTNLSRRSVHR